MIYDIFSLTKASCFGVLRRLAEIKKAKGKQGGVVASVREWERRIAKAVVSYREYSLDKFY